MTKLKNFYVGLSFFATSIVFGQTSKSTSHYPNMYDNQVANSKETREAVMTVKDQIDIAVNSVMSDPVLRNASWGFVIYDPKTKKVINSFNETSSLIPASTTKLLTTETAVAILGMKYTWQTQLEYSGSIDESGTLNGNLYIVGSGDPSLGTGKAGALRYAELINDFKSEIASKGIKKIAGDIVIQTAVFKNNKRDELPANIVWMEHGGYYLPAGSTADVNPRNEQLTAKKSNPFDDKKRYFYISPWSKKMVYSDTYEGKGLTSKLPDPPAYLANNLRASLVKSGVGVSGKVISKVVDPNPESRTVIHTYKSPTLKDIVYDTNQRSDNANAEALLRMVGFQKDGDQTLESGRKVIREHLESINFDTDGLTIFDGSGLSRSNLVTPIAQVKFLTKLMNEPYFKDYFESLPIGGQSGTLKKSFQGNGYGQVFAKTGTLNRVKTLAGYIKTRSGKLLPFSLMINNYTGSVDQVKARMERILDPAIDL